MSNSMRPIDVLKDMKGKALDYFADKNGNLELLNQLSDFDNYPSISKKLKCAEEYEKFYKNYSLALSISMDKGEIVFDEFYYFLLEKICFPHGLP